MISDHNVRETLAICDRAYLVHDGGIIFQGTPDEIVADPRLGAFTSARISTCSSSLPFRPVLTTCSHGHISGSSCIGIPDVALFIVRGIPQNRRFPRGVSNFVSMERQAEDRRQFLF